MYSWTPAGLDAPELPPCFIDGTPGRGTPPQLRKIPPLLRIRTRRFTSTQFPVCRPFAVMAPTMRLVRNSAFGLRLGERAALRRSAEGIDDSGPARAELGAVSPGDLDTDVGRQGVGIDSRGSPLGGSLPGPEGPGFAALHSRVSALTLVTSIDGLLW